MVAKAVSESKQHRHCDKVNVRRALLRTIREHNPVPSPNLSHSRVIYAKIAPARRVLNDRLPCIDVVSLARERDFPVGADRRSYLDKAHIGVRCLEQFELLLHTSYLVFDFFIACQLTKLCSRFYALQLASYYLYGLFSAICCEIF